MKTRHDKKDRYVLQYYENGRWVTEETVTMAGAAQKVRSRAKKYGVSYRAFNTSKNAVYCEARP